jgi:pimeloyl-ACP methyl ester carboxylesterase
MMEANGTKLFWQEHGSGDEAVIFTHGILFSSEMFSAQYVALGARYRCIGFDWRGQGRSETPLGGYDVDNLASDSVALMDNLGVRRAHWVGLSIGGVIGVRIAAERPERLLSLCAIGAAADAEPYEKLARYEALFDAMERDGVGSVLPTVAPILFGPDFLNDAARKNEREEWLRRLESCDGARAKRAAAPILRRRDIQHMLPHVRVPTLICTGELDKANGPDRAAILAGGIAGAELCIIPRVGHTPPIEAPGTLDGILLRFLTSRFGSELVSE